MLTLGYTLAVIAMIDAVMGGGKFALACGTLAAITFSQL